MERTLRDLLAVCACGAVLGGCVAIPCGSRTFTTEYPSEIRATDEKPSKTYEPSVAATPGEDGIVEIGLSGEITTTQPRVQHYEKVSVVKGRWIAFGIYPDGALEVFRPKGSLEQTRWTYVGNGRYSSKGADPYDKNNPNGREFGWNCGMGLTSATLGVLGTPFALLWGIFGPFDHDWHYLGPTLEREPGAGGTTYIRDSRPIDLLLKFSPEEREKIGAWTWHENDQHPQNTFWHGFTMMQWAGVSKFCNYLVQDPVESERTTPVAPKTERRHLPAKGPYGVFLQIPDVGFAQTVDIPRGETLARFDLTEVANGQDDPQGFVRFLPPSGGLEEAWDDDVRGLLEMVQGNDFPVSIPLPLPRLGQGRTEGGCATPE